MSTETNALSPFTMIVKETVKKGAKLPSGKIATEPQRVEVGKIQAFTPLLSTLLPILAGAQFNMVAGKDADGKEIQVVEVDESGLPIYSTDGANWIFAAIKTKVESGARNKLVKGTIKLKDGLSIPTTLETLFEAGTRGGGAALAAFRDCKAAFAEYVGTLGKKESTAELIIRLFNNKDALSLQDSVMKTKMLGYVEGFANDHLEAEDLERFANPLEAVMENCKSETPAKEDDF